MAKLQFVVAVMASISSAGAVQVDCRDGPSECSRCCEILKGPRSKAEYTKGIFSGQSKCVSDGISTYIYTAYDDI